jgi:hypothetical protein
MAKILWMLYFILLLLNNTLPTHGTRMEHKITKLSQNVLTTHLIPCLTLQEIFKLGITDKTLFTILFEIENFEEGQCTIQKICIIDMPPYVHLQYLLQMEKNINLQYLDGLEFMIKNKKNKFFI